MPARSPLPAKLTRPHAGGLLQRQRLFERLDSASSAKCVWIAAPAGAGKTSLVTSWIEARKPSSTWYQVDAGDADPATLVHYLGLAARPTGRKRVQLPHLTPEFLPGFDVFVRRFFEAYFGLHAPGHVLVFDNYQDAAADSPFQAMIDGALHALPAGGRIVCVSREAPPPPLARWSAGSGFVPLDWDDLRLTDEEAQALARQGGGRDGADVVALNGLARGWVAALKLLLRAQPEELERSAIAPDLLFDYLGNEVFERSRPALRDFLVRSVFLPKMTAAAAARLTGHADAGDTLTWLERRRLFTERRTQGALTHYEYHPLFRDFLLQRAQAQFAPEELAQLRRQAAELLEEDGQIDAAAAELLGAQDWAGMGRMVRAHGPALAAQGRTATLEQWITALPPPVVEADPWLTLWLGVCQALRNPEAGRLSLERAYHGFRTAGDPTGSFITLSNLVGMVMFAWSNPTAFEPWIAEFEAVLEANGGTIPELVETQVLGACQGILLLRPDHPVLPGLVARALAISPTLTDATQRNTVGVLCAHYLAWLGDTVRARRYCDELRAGTAGVSAPWPQVHFDIWHAIILWMEADHSAARAVITGALDRASQSGLVIGQPLLYTHLAFTELSAMNTQAAHRALDKGWPSSTSSNAIDLQGYRLLRGAAFLQEGRIGEAAALVQLIQENWHEPPPSAMLMRCVLACELLLLGHDDQARSELSYVVAFGRRMSSTFLQFVSMIPIAWSDFQRGKDEAGLAQLRKALEIGRRHDYKNCHPLWVPHIMSDILARALDEGIEPDYARRLIRLRGLLPPKDRCDLDAWPWPVRIYTLGRFALVVDDQPLQLAARAPKKPLDLLKALIALGGRGVGLGAVTQGLWPDLDGDAAQNALNVALHRLRKLLGDERALVLHDGKLSLDPQRVWVDAWAVQRLAGQADGSVRSEADARRAAAPDLGGSLLRLYLGHFLGDEEAPWALAFRERLRSRFLRACATLAAQFERQERFDQAIDLHRRVVELDPLAEEFHRGLIRNLHALGHLAEALDAYRRCREILSVTLGVEPSVKTQALYRSLKG